MTATTKTYQTAADTAKLVRVHLKENFPGTKFSVTSKTYSGGSSIRVTWTDGPTTDTVQKSAGHFCHADFDGMQDLKTYRRNEYGNDYIFFDRYYSVDGMTRLIELHTARYGNPTGAKAVPCGCGAWYEPTDYSPEGEHLRRFIFSTGL